jgi:hypothetical protein
MWAFAALRGEMSFNACPIDRPHIPVLLDEAVRHLMALGPHRLYVLCYRYTIVFVAAAVSAATLKRWLRCADLLTAAAPTRLTAKVCS